MIMKKKWRQLVCTGLVLAMAVGLCACGKGQRSTNGGGTETSDPSLAKQNVFRSQELDMGVDAENANVRASYRQGDSIYVVMEEYDWGGGEVSYEYQLITLKEDGSLAGNVVLSRSVNDNTQDGDDAAAEEGDDGNTEEGADTDGGAVAVPLDTMEGGASNAYDYTSISNFTFSADGKIYAVKNHSYEDYSDPDNYVSINEYFLCSWDIEGNQIAETPLENFSTENEYVYVNMLFPMEDGSLTMLLSGDRNYKMTIGMDGTLSEREPLEMDENIMNNTSSGFIPQEDGTFLLMYYNEQDNYRMYITSYDIRTNTFGEGTPMPDAISNMGYSSIVGGVATDLVISTSDGIYTYNIGEESMTKIMDYINSDLYASGISSMVMLSETQFVGFYYDQNDNKSKGGLFTHVDPTDIPDKEVLVLGGNYVDYDLKSRTVQFNKSSDKYRIVLKEYNTYNTSEDYTIGQTQLNNDIISGSMPDILVTNTYNMPLESYIAKGLLADVGELIAGDEELSQTTFMENVFDAYRVKEKLYYVIPSFYVNTMAGKKSYLGDRDSITITELEQILTTMPEGAQLVDGLTRSYFMDMVMNYCGNQFVDVNTGKCSFDSDSFIAYLEFAKTLPQELGDDYYGDDYFRTYESQYREDRTLLSTVYISSIRDVNTLINGTFGEEITYVGFPSEGQSGSVLGASNMYALSAKSANLEGAWEFLRYYLTEEFQKELTWNLPVVKAEFDRRAQEATQRPYNIDEDGKKVEYDEYFYMNGEEIKLEPMSQEQVDQTVSFIESVNRAMYYNTDIQNIITEECESFFSGQKSAQEVVGIIQSRVQLYVNENQ